MPPDFSKLLDHPDVDEIITKLVTGTKPKDVADWLKLKYSSKDQSHLRLGIKLLREFLDKNLDLYKTVQKDIKSKKENNKNVSASLKNNKTYQERISEIVDNEIDIKKMMVETGTLLKARIEQYFDKIQENPGFLKPDQLLIRYFETLLTFAEKYDKIVNNSPDQVIQHNITVQVVDKYVALLQECIRSTLAEIDVESANLFLEKFQENMEMLQLPEMVEKKTVPQVERMIAAKVLSEETVGEV